MNNSTLYDLAKAMLINTNPFNKSVDEFFFDQRQEGVYQRFSLCGYLIDDLKDKRQSTDARFADKNNNPPCIKAIAKAMMNYLECYPAPFSYKQHLRRKFYEWITVIQHQYNFELSEAHLEGFVVPSGEKDTAVAMLKELHARDGLTREELSDRLGINPRAVQKDLRKLDKNLYRGDKPVGEGEYVPFYIGGQEVSVKIDEILSDDKGDKKKRFRTLNTVHPIVLQENLMEAGILLQSLSRNYFASGSQISRRIALNIWYQLSDYAQDRIKKYIAVDDPDLKDLIAEFEDDTPDQRMAEGFNSEREMLSLIEHEGYDLSYDEYSMYLRKRGIIPEQID